MMLQRWFYAGLMVVVLTAAACLQANPSEQREVYSLNGDWEFVRAPQHQAFPQLPDQWDVIKVPSNWEMQGYEQPRYQSPHPDGALYRKEFGLPEQWQGREIFLRFEGVAYGFEVRLNDHLLGSWESAYQPVEFNLTDLVDFEGTNTLVVWVYRHHAVHEWDCNDAWALSGIYRDVTLIAKPACRIDDHTVSSRVAPDWSSADVRVAVQIQPGQVDQPLRVCCRVFDQCGGQVAESIRPVDSSRQAEIDFNLTTPYLWSAEQPYLYGLEIQLKTDDGEILDCIRDQLGIRQVSIADGVLMLNHRPIKLRGANRHEIHPELGRALGESNWREDIALIKQANMNFVRTSHYPPHPRFIELCDQAGIYLVCEVPFGKGDSLLSEPEWTEALLTRVKCTYQRDKNHPSVIVWSLGNEDPFTPMVAQACQLMKQLDPTRPICVPQENHYFFSESGFRLPGYIDILAVHYPTPHQVRELLAESARPIIMTECCHSLGHSFENLAELWQLVQNRPHLAGMSIWHLVDQGLYRTADDRPTPELYAKNQDRIWIDETTWLDCAGDRGADGILFADRTPQPDYWLSRQVYSPVQVVCSSLTVSDHSPTIMIPIRNNYDFLAFEDIGMVCRWELKCAADCLTSGTWSLNQPAGSIRDYRLELQWPEGELLAPLVLCLAFSDSQNPAVSETTIKLSFAHSERPNFQAQWDFTGLSVPTKTRFFVSDASPCFTLAEDHFVCQDLNSGDCWLGWQGVSHRLSGPMFRVGRKTTMAERRIARRKLDVPDAFWQPHLLAPNSAIGERLLKEVQPHQTVQLATTFVRSENKPEQSLTGTVSFDSSDTNGWMEVGYHFVPSSTLEGVFLETGLSFAIHGPVEAVRWLGEGPFCSYPGQRRGNHYGWHDLLVEDINFEGNRSGVDLAFFCDRDGNGVLVKAESANLAWERSSQGVIVSHNALVSGRGSKVNPSSYLVWANRVNTIAGSFGVRGVSAGGWPAFLQRLISNRSLDQIPLARPYLRWYD